MKEALAASGLRLRVSAPQRCAYCHDDLVPTTFTGCPHCRTSLHERCWEEVGSCPTLGCGPRAPRRVIAIEPSERRVFGVRTGSAVSGGLGAALCHASAVVVPAFKKMFEETGICLPVPTEFLVWIPTWAWWAGSVASIALLTIKDRWVERSSRGTVNCLYGALLFLAATWIVHALFLPLVVVDSGPL